MPIHPKDFEKNIEGKITKLLTINDQSGSSVHLCNYGARVVSWEYSRVNKPAIDIVLGFGSIDEYLNATEAYHGVTVGRYANRIANGSFKLGDHVYDLNKNLGENSLHGGPNGFHNQFWDIKEMGSDFVTFSLYSAHLEEGFPGNLEVEVTYSLENNQLKIEYLAETDHETPVNLTHHSYFNLNGEGSGSVLDHEARFYAEYYTPINDQQIPTGAVDPVFDTPFDFTQWKAIGQDIDINDKQIKNAGGFDHNFVVKNYHQLDIKPVAEVRSKLSNLKLSCWTDKPGFQFYSANFLDGGDVGKSGKSYKKREAFAIEPQYFPDSPNQVDFPSCILKPEEKYKSTTIYVLQSL